MERRRSRDICRDKKRYCTSVVARVKCAIYCVVRFRFCVVVVLLMERRYVCRPENIDAIEAATGAATTPHSATSITH